MKLLWSRNPLIFYSDEESLDPICASWVWLFDRSNHVGVASSYFWVQKNVYCFFCFFSEISLWSVNTESQIAINVLYTPYFFMLVRHDVRFEWCSDTRVDILNCLFMVSHYISDALDVFLDLFSFRSILDGSQYLEKLIHTFMFERLLVLFFLCLQNVKESLSLHELI